MFCCSTVFASLEKTDQMRTQDIPSSTEESAKFQPFHLNIDTRKDRCGVAHSYLHVSSPLDIVTRIRTPSRQTMTSSVVRRFGVILAGRPAGALRAGVCLPVTSAGPPSSPLRRISMKECDILPTPLAGVIEVRHLALSEFLARGLVSCHISPVSLVVLMTKENVRKRMNG